MQTIQTQSASRFGSRRLVAALLCAVMGLAIARPIHAAGLLIADGGFGGVLEIKEQVVNVTINNGMAVTEVEQTFVNTENRQVEAVYTFPVPKGASVSNFSMWIGGKEMIGEVIEKERAREIYNSYKQQRRDPGLLEQVDYKTFEMRIFPIPARGEQRVRITYYQELDFDHDWATYVYPLATVTRTNIDQKTTGRFALNLRVLSEVPIVEMQSPSHPNEFVFARQSERFQEASLEAHGGDLSRDLVLAYHTSRPHTGIDVITSHPKGEKGYFLLTLTAGEELGKFEVPMDYVFIVDISGSMGNDGKLRLSKESVAAFIEQLGEQDRFELITFNVQPTTLFASLHAADGDGKARANDFLATQQARGGTVLAPAMTTAYKYGDPDRPLNVVILSDGMTEQTERAELLRLIDQRPANARVFAIGVGNEVNRPLLSQLAEDAGGLAAFISHGDDFQRQAQAFRRKLTRPMATNLKITFEGVQVDDLEPTVLPNLYYGAPVRLLGRYAGGGDAKVLVSADVAGKALVQEVTVNLSSKDNGNSQIERMWAWHRVQRLLKEADRNNARSGVIDEVVRLGEGYSIATEYTSFIVLENDAEYDRWRIERRNALRIERDRSQQVALQQRLQRLREKAMADIGPVAASDADPKLNVTSQAQPAPTSGASPAVGPARNRDLDFGGGGGGAIDPISGALVLGLGGLAIAARRKRGKAK